MGKIYNTIIIGGGPAGYSAAIYAARFGMKVLLLTKRFGGLLQDTHIVENYPGYKAISGYELMEKFKEHVESYDVDMIEEEVKNVVKKNKNFLVKCNKKSYEGKTIIFATGSKRRKLNVPGEKKFETRGVSYCAVCDGPLFRNKIVGVVGGSDSAAKGALFLSEHAKMVYIIYRGDKIRAESINYERIRKNKKIEIIVKTNVVEIKGGNVMNSVVFDKAYKGKKEFKLDGLFIEVGAIPMSDLAKTLGVKLNKEGEIKIDFESRTNVLGVYAAGDVTNRKFKQAITGASEGVTAAFSAYDYLNN